MDIKDLTTKQNAYEVTDPSTQISAEEYNTILGETQSLSERIEDLLRIPIKITRKVSLINGVTVDRLYLEHPFFQTDRTDYEVVLVRKTTNSIRHRNEDNMCVTCGRKRGIVLAASTFYDKSEYFSAQLTRYNGSVYTDPNSIVDFVRNNYNYTVDQNGMYWGSPDNVKKKKYKRFALAIKIDNPIFPSGGEFWKNGVYRYLYSEPAYINVYIAPHSDTGDTMFYLSVV